MYDVRCTMYEMLRFEKDYDFGFPHTEDPA
jgi:hypothetical protein